MPRQGGISMIEILITIVIAGVLLSLGLQSFNSMIATTHSRGIAESILSGMRIARSEAIRRNVPVRFQLVSSLDLGCTYSTSSPLWVVTQTDWAIGDTVLAPPTDGKSHGRVVFGTKGYCNARPYLPPDRPDPCDPVVPAGNAAGNRPAENPATCSDDPWVIAKSDATVRQTVNVAADSSIVTFGPLGQVLPNIESVDATVINSLTAVDVTSTNSEAKSWRVRVRTGSGAIKFCDPSAVAPSPMAC